MIQSAQNNWKRGSKLVFITLRWDFYNILFPLLTRAYIVNKCYVHMPARLVLGIC